MIPDIEFADGVPVEPPGENELARRSCELDVLHVTGPAATEQSVTLDVLVAQEGGRLLVPAVSIPAGAQTDRDAAGVKPQANAEPA